LRTLYSPAEYYQRTLECLKRVPADEPAAHHDSLFNVVTAFARITLKLGLLDRERGEFWRFFVRAALRHPRKFAEAMKLAAMGYHFRKLTEAFGK
jgi:hypothetical protein